MGGEVVTTEQQIRLRCVDPHAHPCLRPALVAPVRASEFNGHRGLHFVQLWGGVTARVASKNVNPGPMETIHQSGGYSVEKGRRSSGKDDLYLPPSAGRP